MILKKITIFTPTYNRDFCIHQVYESLLKQTNKNFKWLIIDDGSIDDTSSIIEKWIEKGLLEIDYVFQKNKGMLGAHNTAHSLIDTELTICIDSDDFMPYDAVESILKIWKNYSQNFSVAGIVGLDCYKNGKIIGDSFQENFSKSKYKHVQKIKGDKKYVYRTDLLKEFGPYPTVEGEKFPAQGYLYRLIDADYDLIAVNKILCVVEYLPDGNSFNKISSYLKNPRGFAIHRLLLMETGETILLKFRNAIHYVSSCIISGDYNKVIFNRFFYLTIPAIPLGIILYLFLKSKKGGSVNKKLNK